MRLLKVGSHGEVRLARDFVNDAPHYAIFSHTWGRDEDEVTIEDLKNGSRMNKAGFGKIQFCAKKAKKDDLEYFWVDTFCINKVNYTELSEAIASIFWWYRDARHCYVYLSDVWLDRDSNKQSQQTWELAFRNSRWFTRGCTLQELIAPKSVKFFSQEEELPDDIETLE
ncbi:hypothetical protein MMC25_006136 [Agyrium rufum]|nr:hypothetical protein [Agyrium rufum]